MKGNYLWTCQKCGFKRYTKEEFEEREPRTKEKEPNTGNRSELDQEESIIEPYEDRDFQTPRAITIREARARNLAKKGIDPTHPLRNCDSFARELALKLLKDSGKGYGKSAKPIKERHKPLSVLAVSYVLHELGLYICSSKLYETRKWLKERDEERN